MFGNVVFHLDIPNMTQQDKVEVLRFLSFFYWTGSALPSVTILSLRDSPYYGIVLFK